MEPRQKIPPMGSQISQNKTGPKLRFGDIKVLDELAMGAEISKLKKEKDSAGLAIIAARGGRIKTDMAVKALEEIGAMDQLICLGNSCGYSSVVALDSLDRLLKSKNSSIRDRAIRGLEVIKQCGCADNRRLASRMLVRFGKSLMEKD